MSDSENNGNIISEHRRTSVTGGSAEDLSEYTDADESISAPTEILAEFLTAIMLKDYETALKYCKIILHYEPNNATAREFYPLIIEKIQIMKTQRNDQDEDSSDYSESAPSVSSNSSSTSSDESEARSTDSNATTASYSSLEDEEVDRDNSLKDFKDIANGNTATNKEKIMSEIMNGNTTTICEKKGNEETKKKAENKSDCRILSSDLVKSSRSPSTGINCSNLSLAPIKRRNVISGDIADKLKSSSRTNFSFYFTGKRGLNSPVDEFRLVDNMGNTIISSDSESPSDPTVQELSSKTH